MLCSRLDFREGGIKSQEKLPQRLSPRIRRRMADMEATDARLKWISDYKKHYCHGQPNHKIKTDISTGQLYDGNDVTRSHQYVNMTGRLTKVMPPYVAHLKRRKSAPPVRYSVGDCLVWNQAPVSAPTYRTSTSMDEKSVELAPRPPTKKRPTESLGSPRQSMYKSSSHMDQKSMTPAATAISSFSPGHTQRNSQDFDASKSTTASVDLSTPTVVVN